MSLESFKQPRDFLAGFLIDAVLEDDLLLGRSEIDQGVFHLETCHVDAALGDLELQDLEHLLQLELCRGTHGDGEYPRARTRTGLLEIEALGELAARLIDGIGQFVAVDFRDYVERMACLNDTRALAA